MRLPLLSFFRALIYVAVLLILGAAVFAASPRAPFEISVVPTTNRDVGTITMAKNNPRDFYVILKNVTDKPISVWDDWNSWGYQGISFEVTTPDGKTSHISKRNQGFGRNGPSRFIIQPGESKVFSVRLDESWEVQPPIQNADNTPIGLRAIYEIHRTPESDKYKVWAGRVESKQYQFDLQQW